jgi:hypothetical protein
MAKDRVQYGFTKVRNVLTGSELSLFNKYIAPCGV